MSLLYFVSYLVPSLSPSLHRVIITQRRPLKTNCANSHTRAQIKPCPLESTEARLGAGQCVPALSLVFATLPCSSGQPRCQDVSWI